MTRAGVGAGLALGLVLGGTSSAPALAQDAAVIDKTLELEFWRSVATSTDPALFDAYLQQFPNGTFATLARVKAATLRRAAPMPAAPPSLPPAAPAPAAAPAPVPPPAPPITPAVVTATASPAPAMLPAVASDTAPAGSEAADLALLARLAATQETPALPPSAPAALPVGAPPVDLAAARPRLDTVPSITLPARFCSAEERNAFHAQVFRPASEAAEANNTRAIGYLHAIQARYDAMAMGDPDQRNALAREGLAYKPIADATFQTQQALVRQFDALMAVPIAGCAPAR
ncbi:hypothetical protein [Novosphingobium pokkalii]|uniref:Uncharacterized protein n=1 Tax=Novosphingobium pokkalii TaxID=1770194 RepID=A0ABV7UZL5_9SPHN|nr:hypothetical protein [Novosphingobium pokkalii]GHC99417.1 hypothetical protein GCM10019060_32060 [Novosphingobium pokkalii]